MVDCVLVKKPTLNLVATNENIGQNLHSRIRHKNNIYYTKKLSELKKLLKILFLFFYFSGLLFY